jgi:glycosyltransferase involved in cell wall biosynthesis
MKKRIAAFGFRSIPMTDGSAGADKFASELFPRLVAQGYPVVAYNRVYPGQTESFSSYRGVKIVNLKTFNRMGLDTVWHSMKSTLHIVWYNSADIVHIQNGGNSIWSLILRLAGKKVVISQDGLDWKRDKWPWYGKIYLKISTFITAYLPNRVIFDNVFVRKIVQDIYGKQYDFIPFGSEISDYSETNILEKLDLQEEEYFLFVGRFIPDKGLHYLVSAFNKIKTNKKLVLVGGSPNPSQYEQDLLSHSCENIIFPGYVYGNDADTLMQKCFCYVQPSDVEGLSPVLLQVMGLHKPILCSDIPENLYVVEDAAIAFRKADVSDLEKQLNYAISNPKELIRLGVIAGINAKRRFSWDLVTKQHIEVFTQI